MNVRCKVKYIISSGFGFCLFLVDGSVIIDSLVICALTVFFFFLFFCFFVFFFFGGGGRDWSLFCYALHYCLSLLQSSGRRRNSWLLYLNCLLASAVDCLWCSVSLSHGVVGWAAVCNCGISW